MSECAACARFSWKYAFCHCHQLSAIQLMRLEFVVENQHQDKRRTGSECEHEKGTTLIFKLFLSQRAATNRFECIMRMKAHTHIRLSDRCSVHTHRPFLVYIIAFSEYSLKLSCFVCKRMCMHRVHVCWRTRLAWICIAFKFGRVNWFGCRNCRHRYCYSYAQYRFRFVSAKKSLPYALHRRRWTAIWIPEIAHNLFHGWRRMANECVADYK